MITEKEAPLAERMRPATLDDYVGQKHLVGSGCVLRLMIETGNLSSFILWGPPGVGKTTLASIMAKTLDREFFTLSAISSGVKDVRDVIEKAKSNRMFAKAAPILFIDEIHRFNKAQQDALLGAVENGTVVLIGATTENPSFEVITPLLSRCQTFVLKPLEDGDLEVLLKRALATDEVLKSRKIEVKETEAMFRYAGGDARKFLNIIDIIVGSYPADENIIIDNELVTNKLHENIALYDKNGEQHYDVISAFIKSMRGSDPNGAVYWLARMISGGEDPLFIARRMVILASEDIGLANPNALLLAEACFNAVHQVGMPEAQLILSETCVYLATSPKSNSTYRALQGALNKIKEEGEPPVPLHLRNAVTSLMKNLDYGKDYKYAHDYEGNFVNLEFLPNGLEGTAFYQPGDNPREKEIKARLAEHWKKYGY
ncbi:MAG: replication-associated recombination protein A [Bacteroidales bacterium]